MKKLMTLLALAAMTSAAQAQTKAKHVTGHGAAIAELTWVDGKAALNLGGYGGVLLNHSWMIGGAGNNIFFKHSVNGKRESFQFNYYGLYSEYRFQPQRNVHMSAAVTAALGWQENNLESATKKSRMDGDYTYVIQPKLALNTKLARFMQTQTYLSYRFTGDTKSEFYRSSNHNGLSIGVSFVFGGF